MLLKNAQGHKPAPASAAPTLANNPANNPADALARASPTAAGPAAAAAASGAASAPPVVVGSGSIELVVTHGKVRKCCAHPARAPLNPSPSPITIPVGPELGPELDPEQARYVVRCEAETTLIEAKRLLQPLCGAPPGPSPSPSPDPNL